MAGSAADSTGDVGGSLAPDAVVAWLRDHPRFLTENPDLYRRLAPPARVHGEPLADHMAAMLYAERAHASAMAERADDVLAAGRAAAGLTARVQEAVLALIDTVDVVECVAAELPVVLAVDAAHLCFEDFTRPGARRLDHGTVAILLGSRPVLFRQAPPQTATLHGEAAPLALFDALVRVPGTPCALLALAARDERALDPTQGTGALVFLGRVIAAALRR